MHNITFRYALESESEYQQKIENVSDYLYQDFLERIKSPFNIRGCEFRITQDKDEFIIKERVSVENFEIYLWIYDLFDDYYLTIKNAGDYIFSFRVYGNAKILEDHTLILIDRNFGEGYYEISITLDDFVYEQDDLGFKITKSSKIQNWLNLIKHVDPQDKSGMNTAMSLYFKSE